MNFARPLMLLLLIIPVLAGVFFHWTRRRNDRALKSLAEPQLWSRISDESGRSFRRTQWLLRILTLLCLITALVGPEWGYQWQEVTNRGLEIIVALDTSKSMLATDIKPNRLERAKLAIKDLLSKLKSDKIGLVAFSGSSFLQCPLTMDYNAFAIALDALNVQSIPRGGTAIGAAIQTALAAFQSGSGGSKSLIIISDGENHEGDPVGFAKAAARRGITIETVGIGSPSGELILIRDANGNPSYLKDGAGNVVKTTLNETMLREIARAGNGDYIRSDGLMLGLEELYARKLARLDRSEVSTKWQKRYVDRYQLPLLLALLLLGLELIFSGSWDRSLWRGMHKTRQPGAVEGATNAGER
jgi:Ca-activated chloride channel family protein